MCARKPIGAEILPSTSSQGDFNSVARRRSPLLPSPACRRSGVRRMVGLLRVHQAAWNEPEVAYQARQERPRIFGRGADQRLLDVAHHIIAGQRAVGRCSSRAPNVLTRVADDLLRLVYSQGQDPLSPMTLLSCVACSFVTCCDEAASHPHLHHHQCYLSFTCTASRHSPKKKRTNEWSLSSENNAHPVFFSVVKLCLVSDIPAHRTISTIMVNDLCTVERRA